MMNLQSRPIVLQYDYGFGRRSLLGTLGSWIGCSLPIDLISFNLQMIPREPQGERLMAPPSLVFQLLWVALSQSMPSTKAFLNPSSLEFIFPTKGYVPVISPVPRLSPLQPASKLSEELCPAIESLLADQPPSLPPCYATRQQRERPQSPCIFPFLPTPTLFDTCYAGQRKRIYQPEYRCPPPFRKNRERDVCEGRGRLYTD